ncbi:MAG: PAC2 family protein [Nitriliruptorales bacterium]|nr:PAC2 family protein [Nitriliruptorales bacterium]
MRVVEFEQSPPTLHRPVLLAAFKGWNDAGDAASGAVQMLWHSLDADQFAQIDPEQFFDFQVNRPTVRSAKGGARRIEWPDNRFAWAPLPGADRHVVLLDGTEPNLRWRTFSEGVADLALTLDVEMVLTIGALQVDVPHTRPVPVTGSTTNSELASRLGMGRSTYEGPTGMTGVLHQACVDAGIDAVSLWAGVPHYLSGTPYLTATLSLTERILRVLGGDVSLDELAREAASQADDIKSLLAEDEDLAEYVAELEERFTRADPEALPAATMTGDELAAEFERYLRDRGGH